ncbi:hypothetical protein PVK06_047462 [Gossypium arboreum]|uniref:Reverse transcriptase domain-containing protein n=1 Tax=Gossypium arboreum TaxID=29729 RepID=A0ABR0MF99_GOSAR|nr:hypothetical protein PVK06_047462 [Gossypium arboreum]
MVNRLKEFLGEFISEKQSGFVAGRCIHDNILVAQEVLNCMKLKKKENKVMVVVKGDMDKAYDRVEWDFLKMVLRKLGFSLVWIGWIMETVRSFSYNLLINEISIKLSSPVKSLGSNSIDIVLTYIIYFLYMIHFSSWRLM